MAQQTQEKVRHIQLLVPAETYKEFKKICVEYETNMRAKLLEMINQVITAEAAGRKDFLAMGREERTAIYAEGIRAEVAGHHTAGRYTTHGDDKGIYRLYPDGHREYIDTDRDKPGE
ncbi:MAG: hypothetical protein JW765_03440 [Deltaproteobacteria bacterium]|nr:hypothetical protein [Candidatus Zymogenaceae bacterium]